MLGSCIFHSHSYHNTHLLGFQALRSELLVGIFGTSISIGSSTRRVSLLVDPFHPPLSALLISKQVAWLSTIIALPASGFVKISLFLQYYNLFKVKRYVRITVYIGGTITVAFYSILTMLYFAICSPRRGESLLALTLSKRFQRFTNMSLAVGTISMLLDWVLLILPIIAVWKIQVCTARRAGVILVFATGAL